MSNASRIRISAFVADNERKAVQQAADHLAKALSRAASVPHFCDCVFSSDWESFQQEADATLFLASLLPEVEKEEEWPDTELRLIKAYRQLSQSNRPVFICTIFRHVKREEDVGKVKALRLRIRRLNLLAAEISHETRAHVVDFDRGLADIGALQLQSDYRQGSVKGNAMKSHILALTMANSLDDLISPEVQDAAIALLAISQRIEIVGFKGILDRVRRDLDRHGLRKTIGIAFKQYNLGRNASFLLRQVAGQLSRK